MLPMSAGVPQGNMLGLLLFNIYANDIVSSSQTGQLEQCRRHRFMHYLTWNEHANYLKTKTTKLTGIVGKFHIILPKCAKMVIYNSLTVSHLNYCLLVWCTTSLRNINSNSVLKKRAVKSPAAVPSDHRTADLSADIPVTRLAIFYPYILLKAYVCVVKQSNSLRYHFLTGSNIINARRSRHCT